VLTFFLEGILRRLTLGHVYYTVHIEADLLCIRGPVLVAEAVRVPAIHACCERVVAGADRALVNLVVAAWVLDLRYDSPSASFV
jgi:hypothetical protein